MGSMSIKGKICSTMGLIYGMKGVMSNQMGVFLIRIAVIEV